MRILVIGQDSNEKKQLMQTLQDDKRTVRVVSDERSALPALQQAGAQLVIVPTDTASDAALACIRLLHENSRTTKPYFLLAGPNLPNEFLSAAYDGGLDSHVNSPYTAPYLLSRIDAIHRRISPNDYKPRVNGAAPPSRVNGAAAAGTQGPLDPVVGAEIWRNAPAEFAGLMSKFLTLATTPGPLRSNNVPLDFACAIHLASSKLEAEIRIAVGADTPSASALAVHMFGPGNESLAEDMVGELANNFMGAMKSGLSALALGFTGGLPESLATECVLRPHDTYQVQQAFQLELADARLVVHVGLRSKGNLFVTPDALKEGMVLAKDLFNQKGLLLVNHGTRLSSNMIERLRGVLAPKQPIEVMTT
jgi:CheY-like chemotaxis protein